MNLLIAILTLGAISFLTRLAPLAIPNRFRHNRVVHVLGAQLPGALMILLVIHSIKITQPITPQVVGILTTALVHFWRRQVLLSIVCGLSTYILISEILKCTNS